MGSGLGPPPRLCTDLPQAWGTWGWHSACELGAQLSPNLREAVSPLPARRPTHTRGWNPLPVDGNARWSLGKNSLAEVPLRLLCLIFQAFLLRHHQGDGP